MTKNGIVSAILLLFALSASAAVVQIEWTMPKAQAIHRDAVLAAYCEADSTYEVPVRWIGGRWILKAEIQDRYFGQWILVGNDRREVVAQRFQLVNGARLSLTWIPFEVPDISSVYGEGGRAQWTTPKVDPSLVLRWEILKDGKVVTRAHQFSDGAITAPTSYQLRGVLVGTGKPHHLLSPIVEIIPDSVGGGSNQT